jgi:hypothetical protein
VPRPELSRTRPRSPGKGLGRVAAENVRCLPWLIAVRTRQPRRKHADLVKPPLQYGEEGSHAVVDTPRTEMDNASGLLREAQPAQAALALYMLCVRRFLPRQLPPDPMRRHADQNPAPRPVHAIVDRRLPAA